MKSFIFEHEARRELLPLLRKMLQRQAEERALLVSVAARLRMDIPPLAPEEEQRLLSNVMQAEEDPLRVQRQRTLATALDEAYFHAILSPGNAVFPGAVAAPVLNGAAEAIGFPAAGGGIATTNHESRELWVATRPRMYVWYTSDLAGTANFTVNGQVIVFGAGGTTAGVARSSTWTMRGPAVAGDVMMSTSILGTVKMPSSPTGVVRVFFARPAADTNANALQVLLAAVVFEETA